MASTLRLRADIIALDRDGEAVLIAEVKATPASGEAREQLAEYVRRFGPRLPFAMLIDPATIEIYRLNGEGLSDAVARLPTPEVISRYDPDAPRKKILDFYLGTLIEAWLRDIAYHWKSDTPPFQAELAAIGLAEQLADGTTVSETDLAA